MHASLLVSFVLMAPQAGQPEGNPIPQGKGDFMIDYGTKKLKVFTYKPKNYTDGPLVVVFHGTNRNADEYRDFAISMSERFGALVAAPLFDSKQFSNNLYHLGGLLKGKGSEVNPPEQWTGNMTPRIAAEVRKLEKRPKMPYYFIGHSAGGQFLSRISGFVDTGAVRVVAANPGSHLFPTRDMPYPNGFGDLPKELSDDDAIRLYLAKPLTIYVGTADIELPMLPTGKYDKLQGERRYHRGKNCYKLGKELAAKNNWSFNWTIVEAPGIAHDGKGMLSHDNCIEALFGIPFKKAEPVRLPFLQPTLVGRWECAT